jgi:release factor glutamine methyltransferase
MIDQDQDVSLHSSKSKSSCLMSVVLSSFAELIPVLFAIDISSLATLTTVATLERNIPKQFNSVVQSDLLSALRLRSAVDVLVFNPPYVPTDHEDAWAGEIRSAWRGGGMGMETTSRVLDSLSVRICIKGAN